MTKVRVVNVLAGIRQNLTGLCRVVVGQYANE